MGSAPCYIFNMSQTLKFSIVLFTIDHYDSRLTYNIYKADDYLMHESMKNYHTNASNNHMLYICHVE